MRYSVIVPLHNKEKIIERCLLSILNQTKKPSQVIVIDDASTDSSLSIVERFYSKVWILKNRTNQGKALSINLTIPFVLYPYTLIVDADTYLDKNYVKEVFKGFKSRRVKGVCGFVLPSETDNFLRSGRLFEYLFGQSLKWIQNKLNCIWVLCGCATMWRTFFLQKHSIPLDTIVEDMDISWLVQTQKDYLERTFKIGYSQKAVCYTEEPRTYRELIKQIDRWYSYREVIQKHFKKITINMKALTFLALGLTITYPVSIALACYSITQGNWELVLYPILTASVGIIQAIRLKVSVLKSIVGFFSYLCLSNIIFAVCLKCLIRPKRKW